METKSNASAQIQNTESVFDTEYNSNTECSNTKYREPSESEWQIPGLT
jgi:hypothetical protein